MTSLFNLFCPVFMWFTAKLSILLSVVITALIVMSFFLNMSFFNSSKSLKKISFSAFPMGSSTQSFLMSGFLVLALFNLFSLICYSFPITTILGLNMTFGLSLWLGCLFFILTKSALVSSILPLNSPNGLAPFLCIVELVSILVRPMTLSFRLLANMSAGHVLLTLACKMSSTWILGTLLGLLELMVCLVQAFVFLMLTAVYLEEALHH